MDFKKLFILVLIILIIFSVSFVSAVDNETTQDIITQTNENEMIEITDENIEIESPENQEILSDDSNSRVIYVGENKTSDGGNGTSNNPFNSFELVSNNLSGENKVEINVYTGTYYLNSDLKFNTTNLFITGIGKVTIKNLENKEGAYASFGLTSSSGNFTFSNLIFDGSNCNSLSSVSGNKPHFHAFKGVANLGIFNNCTFTGFNDTVICSAIFNRHFINCNFINSFNYIDLQDYYKNLKMKFEYCIISKDINLGLHIYLGANVTFDSVWFGQNSIPSYICPNYANIVPYTYNYMFPVTRYAIFSASENYIGNNTYEILGKLMWNDTTTDGIEKLNPIPAYLSSKTGNLSQMNTTLENGTFKVIYKSISKKNKIDIILDSEEITLTFNNNFQVNAEPIYYGDNQNITVILPQNSNAILNITVNNKTYKNIQINSSSFNYTIPDELLAGTYQVYVELVDLENHNYGYKCTNLTISKINQKLFILTPAEASVDDENINITLLLPNDASGNVTIFRGHKNMTQYISNGGEVAIDISDLLIGGDNTIEVYYSGDKKYTNQSKSDIISVNRINPDITIETPTNPTVNDDVINIKIVFPKNASGNVTISSRSKNITYNNINETTIINISDLLIGGNNTILVKYSGDNWWDSQIKKETIYVTKLIPQMTINITKDTVVIGENITVLIRLPQDAKGNISINDNYLFNINDEITKINIPSLISGINNLKIIYQGNDKYYQISKIIPVLVEKLNISSNEMKINVNNFIFSINLPNDTTGNVTISINGKKYSQSLINAKVSLKLNDLTPGKYTAIVTYGGDDRFNQINKTIDFTVPKPILKAKDITMLYTSGLKYTVCVTVGGNPVIGKTITFTINGNKITRITDNNGYASVKLDLPPKSTKYVITAQYLGVKIVNKVKVNSLIQAKNLKVKKPAKTLKIKITLKKVNGKYLDGKKVTLKFNDKKYTAKTNKKGVATFKLNKNVFKNLKTGKTYNYQVIYLKDKVSKKITIKK